MPQAALGLLQLRKKVKTQMKKLGVSMPQAALGLLQLHGSWSRVLQGLRVSA